MLAIQNSKFYTQGKLQIDAVLLLSDGRIKEVITGSIPEEYEVYDAGGALLAPGFLDLQIYGSGGNLFSAFPTVETLKQMDDDLAAKGTVGFLVCVATNSPEIVREAIAAAKIYMPKARGFLGLHLEGPFLNPARLGAHVAEYVHPATLDEVRELIDGSEEVVKMMTVAYELQDKSVIDYLLEQGIVLSLGHSDATFEQANDAYAAGFKTTTHLFNAMPSIHHRSPNLPSAVLLHPTAMASIIADGAHVDFNIVKIAYRLMQGRLFLITDAVTACNVGPYQHQLRGSRYTTPEGTISGSNITLLDAVSNCVNRCDIPLPEALKMATELPAKLMGLSSDYGMIAKGQLASFVLLDDDLNLKQVFIKGLQFDPV